MTADASTELAKLLPGFATSFAVILNEFLSRLWIDIRVAVHVVWPDFDLTIGS